MKLKSVKITPTLRGFKAILKVLWRARRIIYVLVVVAVVILAFAFKTPIKNQLNSWKLLPQPEKLTELYFTHPNNLPKTYTPGRAQDVSITVHNLEGQNYLYNYKIVETSQDGRRSQVLQTGKFVINANQYSTKLLNILPINLGDHVNLSIEITNVNQSISIWAKRG